MRKYTLLVVPLVASILLMGCGKKTDTDLALDKLSYASKQETQKEDTSMENQAVTELIKEDIVVGTGKEATTGALVTVHYKGTFLDGKVFDTSLQPGREPFEFQLGAGMVIEGWDVGVAGMKVGGKRKLTIPSDMAYGSRGAGASIPPNTPLLFDVELLEVN
jgi:FKBP-type peptidyl-prolyl cis-trans isomerase FkpA